MIEKAKLAKRESKYVDFKESFDVDSAKDWCEIVKDIVAMANSSGGAILIGVKNDGSPSGFDVSRVLSIDPAQLTDKIAKYTGEQFSEFEIQEITKNDHKVVVFLINGVHIPIIFIKPGTYDIGGGYQQTAFGKGTIYFRHGAKSEPGNTDDLRKSLEKEVERIRKSWLGNVRKVVTAPPGYTVRLLPHEVKASQAESATPIRIVDEANAPAYRLESPNTTHPYRQKEVLKMVNGQLHDIRPVNGYDILCVRKVFEIDEKKPNYYYKPIFASPQYSQGFVDWLVESCNKDPLFFEKVRKEYKDRKLWL